MTFGVQIEQPSSSYVLYKFYDMFGKLVRQDKRMLPRPPGAGEIHRRHDTGKGTHVTPISVNDEPNYWTDLENNLVTE